MNRAILILLLALVATALAGAAQAAPQRAQLSDIEDEVMCPICGTALGLSQSPQAERERAFIRRLIAAGQTKQQIKDALVAQYGPRVLATPSDHGFDLSAWLVPILSFAVAAGALALGIRRWRREEGATGEATAPPAAADSERLEGDLSRYDV